MLQTSTKAGSFVNGTSCSGALQLQVSAIALRTLTAQTSAAAIDQACKSS